LYTSLHKWKYIYHGLWLKVLGIISSHFIDLREL
jgi:hypothetical protein